MLPKTEHGGRTFDRVPSRDPRRGNFMAEEVLVPTDIFPKTWTSRLTTDQGREGACVGHGHTTDAVASPYPASAATVDQANAFAHNLYKRAQQLDEYPGEDYSGSSVDAGFKAIRELGWIKEWRWMKTIQEIRTALLTIGPVVLGVNWYDEMYTTTPSGIVKVGGPKVGGHCITLIGYHPGMRIAGEDWSTRFEVYKWKNTWGTDYGKNGVGYVKAVDLQEMLIDEAEAGVAIGRSRVNLIGQLPS